jgi:hypothetical protein
VAAAEAQERQEEMGPVLFRDLAGTVYLHQLQELLSQERVVEVELQLHKGLPLVPEELVEEVQVPLALLMEPQGPLIWEAVEEVQQTLEVLLEEPEGLGLLLLKFQTLKQQRFLVVLRRAFQLPYQGTKFILSPQLLQRLKQLHLVELQNASFRKT